jgi:hypothetical protein
LIRLVREMAVAALIDFFDTFPSLIALVTIFS